MANPTRKNPHRSLRAFCSTFMLTLCLLLLGSGLLVAEYNTRRTVFGQTRMRMECEYEDGRLRIYTPAADREYELPPAIEQTAGHLWTLLPARVRTAAWVTEAQQAAAPYALRWLLDTQEEWAEDYQ